MNKRNYSLIALEVIMIAAALIVFIPLFLILINSLKDARQAALLNLALPDTFHFENYLQVFRQGKIVRGYFNSIILSAGSVFGITVSASMAAFVIERSGSRGYRYIYRLFIIGLIMPVAIIPTIRLMMTLKVHNTYPGIILYYTATLLPFSVFVLTGFMKSIPRELDESCLADGCSYAALFYRIIFPLLKPALITVSIIVVLVVWNDFFGPFYLISDSSKWTITLSIFNFANKFKTNWALVFADIVIVITPVVIMYILLQKHIIDGMTAGSIKG